MNQDELKHALGKAGMHKLWFGALGILNMYTLASEIVYGSNYIIMGVSGMLIYWALAKKVKADIVYRYLYSEYKKHEQ